MVHTSDDLIAAKLGEGRAKPSSIGDSPHKRRVEVYFNLHKKCLSVRHRGLVIGHAAAVELADVTFAVSEAGRQRVLRDGRKNVHAFIRGTLVSSVPHGEPVPALTYDKAVAPTVTYNPYKNDSFVKIADGSKITNAQKTLVVGRRIYAESIKRRKRW